MDQKIVSMRLHCLRMVSLHVLSVTKRKRLGSGKKTSFLQSLVQQEMTRKKKRGLRKHGHAVTRLPYQQDCRTFRQRQGVLPFPMMGRSLLLRLVDMSHYGILTRPSYRRAFKTGVERTLRIYNLSTLVCTATFSLYIAKKECRCDLRTEKMVLLPVSNPGLGPLRGMPKTCQCLPSCLLIATTVLRSQFTMTSTTEAKSLQWNLKLGLPETLVVPHHTQCTKPQDGLIALLLLADLMLSQIGI
mmetsp:Transcript_34860/g.84328  ORF Transcript_34860/g.84328 Transcript_34860/m.84328 type:complete len:244 (+) Transcript_34860:1239-1970(+)